MTTATYSTRVLSDHFEPEPALSPEEARKLRAHLEQIDYAAFAANREISGAIGSVDLSKFQKLAIATAHARAKWVATSLAMTSAAPALTPDQIAELTALRTAFEELTQAYEAMRRMVERGYLSYLAR